MIKEELNSKNVETKELFSSFSHSWGSVQFLSAFDNEELVKNKSKAELMIKSKKVLDLFISQGSITAKVQDERGALNKVKLEIEEINNKIWDNILKKIANTAFHTAKLLSFEVTEDIEEIFRSEGRTLFPSIQKDIKITYREKTTEVLNPHIVSLILKVAKIIQKDPFVMFLIRGKNKNDVISEIRKKRLEIKTSYINSRKNKQKKETPPPSIDISTDKNVLENFWRVKREVYSLTYDLKADELPASILKFLDPLPLSGLDEDTDSLLEEAYAKVATRAQAYGMGL